MQASWFFRLCWIALVLVWISGVGAGAPAQAQENPVTSLARLEVEIWPDYDEPAVLVLLSGTLPAGAALPARLVLNVAENARLNAVARIDADNRMYADVTHTFDEASGRLSLTLATGRFRVEYYLPYQREGATRTFSLATPSGLTISQLDISVQQPAAATVMTIDPSPVQVVTGADSLRYHLIDTATRAADDPVTLQVRYEADDRLTVEALSPAGGTAPATSAPAATGGAGNTTLLIIAGLGLAAVAFFLGAARRDRGVSRRRGARKPRPRRATGPRSTTKPAPTSNRPAASPGPEAAPSAPGAATSGSDGVARFCHQCGAAAEPGDRFCRQCGTGLRRLEARAEP